MIPAIPEHCDICGVCESDVVRVTPEGGEWHEAVLCRECQAKARAAGADVTVTIAYVDPDREYWDALARGRFP